MSKTAHIGRKKPKNTSAIDKREVRQIRKELEALGYRTRRQPGSGNRDISLPHDVWWGDSPVGTLLIEDKYREECMWKTFLSWKAGADILTVRQARGERMCFMSWELFLDLVGEAVTAEMREVINDLAKCKSGIAILDDDANLVIEKRGPKRKIQSQGFQKGHRPMRRA